MNKSHTTDQILPELVPASLRIPEKKVFFDTDKLPWTPGPLIGTWFKLLNINPVTGGTSLLFRVDPNQKAPLHKHIGCVEGYIIDGEFGYGEDRGTLGAYLYEADAAIHEPTSTTGFTAFLLSRGTSVGYLPDGSPAALIDAYTYFNLAKLNGAVDHLPEDLHRRYDFKRPGIALPERIEDLVQVEALPVTGVDEERPARPAFTQTQDIPWTPWIMPGTEFKLLNINNDLGGWSMMLKVRAGQEAELHHHVGALEGIIVSGGFQYGSEDIGRPMSYVWEDSEAVHEPFTQTGFEMFVTFYGPTIGYTPEGAVAGVADGQLMLQLARENNATKHLDPYV